MTRTALLLVLTASVALSGCLRGLSYHWGAKARIGYTLTDPADRKSPRDRFLRFEGKSRRGDGQAFEILPYFIYGGPFTIVYDVGIFDAERMAQSDGAIGCLELFDEAFFGDPMHTVDLCGRYVSGVSGGYQAFNSENSDQQFYPGALRLEARVSYDGTDLTYETRPEGAPIYNVVTTVASWTPIWPVLTSFGGVALNKRGVVDFDNIQLTDTMPLDTDVMGAVGWHLQESSRLACEGMYAIDGAAPDFALALAAVAGARAEYTDVLTLSAGLDVKIGKQVIRYTEKADRQLARAQGELQDSDAEGAFRRIGKGMRLEGLAFQRLYGLDFREQF
jgi:hypothetical protein